MLISDIKIHQLNIPLTTPFKIANSTQTEYNGIILELQTESSLSGFGEAAPSARVTGETTTSVMNALETKAKPLVLGRDALELEHIMSELEQELPNQPSACCAVDIALHDLKGQVAKLPIKHLLGGYRDEIPISFTVVIGSIKDTIKSAQQYINQGAQVLKVKLGVDPELDIQRISALRDAFGYVIKLTGDANQGYTVKQAIRTLNALDCYELEFVEQPVAADDLLGLQEVHKATTIPIMADEAAQSVADVMELIKLNAVDMVNIKLQKCGGLRNATKISNITEGVGVPCQVGCMIETGVGITAGTHLALAHRNIQNADLDGHLFLTRDIISGHQITQMGVNSITGQPGLGVCVSTQGDIKS
jgi:o-succinylbenzoate synthase